MSPLAFALLVTTASTAAPRPPPVTVPTPPRASKPVPAQSEPSPVVIAEGGNIGMAFRFGGLANLSTDGNVRILGESFPVTQVGLKYVVSRNLHLPFFFGIGVRSVDDGPSDDGIWGFDLGGGLEYHFRIWRRISPYFGLLLNVGALDGGDGVTATFGIGPALGVEYFVADRLSLSVQYGLSFQFFTIDGGESSAIDFGTIANGAATLTFYF